ncbi:MAG: nuclease [Methylococcaceae bacterium]|nr:nuclease [Methylococcaceae bacterium]
MDFSAIISPILNVFWYLIPLAFLAATLKSSWFKGIAGEFMVNLAAKLMLNKDKYHLIKNGTLTTEDGTTQIDHIIVSKQGVFVVETKNMKGWIFGKANQKMWTQKIYKHSNQFQNPLHQNYKHTKTLENLLELQQHQIHSVIAFVGNSTFKTEMPDNVTHGCGYIRFIKSKTQEVLSDIQVTSIIRQIEDDRLTPSFKTNREHVKHVKEIVSEKKNNHACPQCGSSMVIREAKKGVNKGHKFWGCSTFPQCKGTVNII